ncbi:DUF3093 domain-containing protein [Herbiconiux moechotypicola]|uniref:DUF3093 domain-containing protein n=1 Tax=Herbiconiux moechotypicola TaxID=637393 RepID=A0ABN3D6L7_9MICO|nr:DUF3093 domain-containing protein [Herbiconiux moechotypicola]MCS5728565.1 DUF3093 domain-containing protein [Herbiconiux moechotypicola]
MQLYRERLHPSVWVFLSTALVLPASIIVFAPLAPVTGVLIGTGVGLVLYAGVVLVLVTTAPVIEVTATELRAGRARIPLDLLGESVAYAGEAATAQRGRRLDARAYLCIRGWVDQVVRIQIADPHDPTPYWLVSSRRPGDLVEALTRRPAGSRD